MTTLNGSCEVASWDESPYDERHGRRLTKASVTQRFSGGVSGEGSAEWLTSYNEDATAQFVGLQLVDGEIAGSARHIRTRDPRRLRWKSCSLGGIGCSRLPER
jgi:hypothetical protein